MSRIVVINMAQVAANASAGRLLASSPITPKLDPRTSKKGRQGPELALDGSYSGRESGSPPAEFLSFVLGARGQFPGFSTGPWFLLNVRDLADSIPRKVR